MADQFEYFAVESKDRKNRLTGEKWHYAGLLAVPVDKKDDLLARLEDARKGCDSELKSTDLDHLPKRRAAENWIDLVRSDKGEDSIYISLLDLNATLLNPSAFGGGTGSIGSTTGSSVATSSYLPANASRRTVGSGSIEWGTTRDK